jgi:hypothetical protein
MGTVRVGIREFREKLSRFLVSPKLLAITRHGETVGFYIPARRKPTQVDLEAFRRSTAELAALIAASGASEDELVQEFKDLRKLSRKTAR